MNNHVFFNAKNAFPLDEIEFVQRLTFLIQNTAFSTWHFCQITAESLQEGCGSILKLRDLCQKKLMLFQLSLLSLAPHFLKV